MGVAFLMKGKAAPVGVAGESMSEEKKATVWAKNIMEALDVLNWAKERECNMTLSFETICRYLKAVAKRNSLPLAEEALLRVIACGRLIVWKFEDGSYRYGHFELPKTADVLREWEQDVCPKLIVGYVANVNGGFYLENKIAFDVEKQTTLVLFEEKSCSVRQYGKYEETDEDDEYSPLEFISYDGNIKELPEAGVVRKRK